MKIVPTNIAQQIDRVDRQYSLAIGISTGLLAFWSVYRVIWSLYLAVTYDFVFGALVFPIVLWGVIGVVAAITSIGFLTRHLKGSATGITESNPETNTV
ncbi:hypothetical protein ORI20_04345 [Mycobacterium sp. CVI_P3]|uniref:Uncharacterized protein n=1 Tax=Mycobacterium pinniadriaticum TaxID=2994102 RepID=A0ABT3S8U2_9MYCO|nr:hypothetical protein [Mycobacterium pinniadriaticum]MCX2929491.1 hypothetical protein [Mycobacterium pinniadriaticum]MCX2935915.1 hypothetical protein [Mycobacterium pinniadriaticum]